jgi:hypothetical protein
MGSVNYARLDINGYVGSHVPIVLPEHDPYALIDALTRVRTTVTLTADEIDDIGENGTFYDLRIRLYEEDNSSWPWGDDNDDQIWQRRRKLKGIASQTVGVSVNVRVLTLKDYGAEYYAGVRLYRRTTSGMSNLHSRRSNTVVVDYSDSA